MRAGDSKDWKGRYNAPGGHIEKGETVIEAANKEVREETGLDPRATKLRGVIHKLGFFGKDVMLFVTTSVAKKEKLREHREGIPEWIQVDKMSELDLLEDLELIVEQIRSLKEDQVLIGTCQWDGKDGLVDISIEAI